MYDKSKAIFKITIIDFITLFISIQLFNLSYFFRDYSISLLFFLSGIILLINLISTLGVAIFENCVNGIFLYYFFNYVSVSDLNGIKLPKDPVLLIFSFFLFSISLFFIVISGINNEFNLSLIGSGLIAIFFHISSLIIICENKHTFIIVFWFTIGILMLFYTISSWDSTDRSVENPVVIQCKNKEEAFWFLSVLNNPFLYRFYNINPKIPVFILNIPITNLPLDNEFNAFGARKLSALTEEELKTLYVHDFQPISKVLFQRFLNPQIIHNSQLVDELYTTYNEIIRSLNWNIDEDKLDDIWCIEASEITTMKLICSKNFSQANDIENLFRDVGLIEYYKSHSDRFTIEYNEKNENEVFYNLPFKLIRHPYIIMHILNGDLVPTERRRIKLCYSSNPNHSAKIIQEIGINFQNALNLIRGSLIEFLVYLWGYHQIWKQKEVQHFKDFVIAVSLIDHQENYQNTQNLLKVLISDVKSRNQHQELTGDNLSYRLTVLERFDTLCQRNGIINKENWQYNVPDESKVEFKNIGIDYFFPGGKLLEKDNTLSRNNQIEFLLLLDWFWEIIRMKSSQQWLTGNAAPETIAILMKRFLEKFFILKPFSANGNIIVPNQIFQNQNISGVFNTQFLNIEYYLPWVLFTELFVRKIFNPGTFLGNDINDQYNWIRGLHPYYNSQKIDQLKQQFNTYLDGSKLWNPSNPNFVYIIPLTGVEGGKPKEYYLGIGTRTSPSLGDIQLWCRSENEFAVFKLLFKLLEFCIIDDFGYEGFSIGYRAPDEFIYKMSEYQIDFLKYRTSYPDFWIKTKENRIVIINVLGGAWITKMKGNDEYPYKNDIETKILNQKFNVNVIFFAIERIKKEYLNHRTDVPNITINPFFSIESIDKLISFCAIEKSRNNTDFLKIIKSFAISEGQLISIDFENKYNYLHPVDIFNYFQICEMNKKISLDKPRINKKETYVQMKFDGLKWNVINEDKYDKIDAKTHQGILKQTFWQNNTSNNDKLEFCNINDNAKDGRNDNEKLKELKNRIDYWDTNTYDILFELGLIDDKFSDPKQISQLYHGIKNELVKNDMIVPSSYWDFNLVFQKIKWNQMTISNDERKRIFKIIWNSMGLPD